MFASCGICIGLFLYLDTEANQSKDNGHDDLEARILHEESFKVMGQVDMVPNVGLHLLDAVDSENEPELEGTEPSAQRDLPVLKYHAHMNIHYHQLSISSRLKYGILLTNIQAIFTHGEEEGLF